MNENVAKLLNEQVNKEFYSAYLYLDFANYYAEVGLTVLKTGTEYRRRKREITQCCSFNIF